MRLLGLIAIILMHTSIPQTNWEGVVLVDARGVYHLHKGEKPVGWTHPKRGYVLGIPLRYSNISQDALEDIPGIGPSLASKFMSLRKKKDNVTWDDVDSIKGIGEKKLSILKKNLRLFD